jgi:hypothetical protein
MRGVVGSKKIRALQRFLDAVRAPLRHWTVARATIPTSVLSINVDDISMTSCQGRRCQIKSSSIRRVLFSTVAPWTVTPNTPLQEQRIIRARIPLANRTTACG